MVRCLFPLAPFPPLGGILPSAVPVLCATRLHNRSPDHHGFSPVWLVPVPSSSPPASVRVSLLAASARESTSGNRPCALIPESGAPEIHRKTSPFPSASTGQNGLRTDTAPVPQSGSPFLLPY